MTKKEFLYLERLHVETVHLKIPSVQAALVGLSWEIRDGIIVFPLAHLVAQGIKEHGPGRYYHIPNPKRAESGLFMFKKGALAEIQEEKRRMENETKP